MQYNRAAAREYADEWAYRRNPRFFDFSEIGGDCTNFASQVLYAGSGVMNYTPVYGWYYISTNDRTASWTGVNELYRFLVNNKGAGPQARVVGLNEIDVGDIIQLRFSGTGRFDHSPVVMDVGMRTPDTILLAAHTNDANCRPLSTYPYNALRPLHIFNVGE